MEKRLRKVNFSHKNFYKFTKEKLLKVKVEDKKIVIINYSEFI